VADDVLLAKAQAIERSLGRIASRYQGPESRLETDLDMQDIVVLNLQRACEAAIDGAMRVINKNRLGLPQESREAFTMLEEAGLLDRDLAARLRRMVGFRNVAVHDYQRLDWGIVRSILDHDLPDLRRFGDWLVAAAR